MSIGSALPTNGAGAYAPSMNRVRTGELPWTNLDALHRMGLDTLIEKFAITGLDESDKVWFNLTTSTGCNRGRIRCRV